MQSLEFEPRIEKKSNMSLILVRLINFSRDRLSVLMYVGSSFSSFILILLILYQMDSEPKWSTKDQTSFKLFHILFRKGFEINLILTA